MMYFVVAMNLVVIVLGIIYAGLSPLWTLDIPSVIIVFVPAFLAPLAAYGKLVYGKAFSAAFGSTQLAEEEKRDAANVFKLIGNVAVGFGWIGVLIGALAMLKNLGAGDMSALGIGIAADLITIFYAYILKYGFCKLAEYKVGK